MISVVMPVYNRAVVFKKALASVLRQSYKAIEVIVVDDGSAEDIERVVLSAKDPRIVYIAQENKGAPAARNRGMEISRGEFIIFWDADVVGYPDMLTKLHSALVSTRGASYAYCDFFVWRGKKMKTPEFSASRLKKMNYIHTTSLILREQALAWDESLKRFQDWDLWLSMLELGRIGVRAQGTLFRIASRGTMSAWLPSFCYHSPWSHLPLISKKIRAYERARAVIYKKHGIT